MHTIPFWKITPGGNPTLLFRAEDVPDERRASFAAAAMSPLSISAEQAGFLRFGPGIAPRLDMMGGEFCLNATRAFAYLLALNGLLSETAPGRFKGAVSVSGADGPVGVRVDLSSPAKPRAGASLHLGALPAVTREPDGVRMVRLPGIVHLIHDGTPPADNLLEDFCTEEREKLGLAGEEAVGHLWIRQAAAHADSGTLQDGTAVPALRMHPVVWVRDTATLCRETACGSGTMACAIDARTRTGATEFRIIQPSGVSFSASFRDAGPGTELFVDGPVTLAAQGGTDADALIS